MTPQIVSHTPNEGDLRVWWVQNFTASGSVRSFPVASPEAAIVELHRLADEDLQDDTVWGNAGGLEVYEAGEWCEWYNDEGEDIDEYAERLEAAKPANGVANLLAHVEVYEAPLAYDAPTQPELSEMPEVKPEYLEADYFASKEADAVLHEAPALDGIRKGDLVRVQTSNPRVPFVGRVEKVTWDGRLIVRQGTVTYRTTLDKATVLMKVNGVETAAQR